MPRVDCLSIRGGTVRIPRERLVFRPSVYGAIIHRGRILMVRNKSNGKLFFPGGGVNVGETMTDALKREVREETGISIDVGRFLRFKEQFFYWDPGDEAYHMFCFFYSCTPRTTSIHGDEDVDDAEAEQPRWVPLAEAARSAGRAGPVREILRQLTAARGRPRGKQDHQGISTSMDRTRKRR